MKGGVVCTYFWVRNVTNHADGISMPIKSFLKMSLRGFFEKGGEKRGGYDTADPPPMLKEF